MRPGHLDADRALPPGAIRPRGWLERQLRLQADGITGRLEEVWPDVGPDSGWLGGDGESWERGPYYLDGLVPLAHVLDDARLHALARPWLEWMLGSQDERGWFGPASNDDWWPRMVALKVLTQHADATGDPRVEPFVAAYLRHVLTAIPERPLRDWGQVRAADLTLTVWWLHERRPEPWLLELVDLIAAQTHDWERWLEHDVPSGQVKEFAHPTHGVNVAMGAKTGPVAFLRDGDPAHLERRERGLAELDRWHGLAHGWPSGDEFLGGPEATAGVETCLVVEAMFTQEVVARILGRAVDGDRLERLAFNLLPASSDPRQRGHQYHQQANQVACTIASRPWSYSADDANTFGLEPHFGCCTANLHQGWPKFAAALWSATADGGLRAIAYAPCAVRATLPVGEVSLEVETEYPFDETVRVRVGLAAPARFPLLLRVPGWCERPELRIADAPAHVAPVDGWLRLERDWADGDVVELRLPMRPRVGKRPRRAVAVELGPLVLALPVREHWRPLPEARGLGEWEVLPLGTWNYGLIDPEAAAADWVVERRPVGDVPFAPEDPPVRISVGVSRIDGWGLAGAQSAPPPAGPVLTPNVLEQRELVPYGSARLRLTELPTTRPAPGPVPHER